MRAGAIRVSKRWKDGYVIGVVEQLWERETGDPPWLESQWRDVPGAVFRVDDEPPFSSGSDPSPAPTSPKPLVSSMPFPASDNKAVEPISSWFQRGKDYMSKEPLP